uniref:Uncharacterized protein n=1 Tax=Anolis carolinensis TaxID=28377 RepID=A0A803TGW8_ANOCA
TIRLSNNSDIITKYLELSEGENIVCRPGPNELNPKLAKAPSPEKRPKGPLLVSPPLLSSSNWLSQKSLAKMSIPPKNSLKISSGLRKTKSKSNGLWEWPPAVPLPLYLGSLGGLS